MKRWMSVLLCVLMLHVLPVSAAEYVVDLESEYFSSAGNWLASGLKGYNDSKTMYAREEGTSAFFASPLQKAGNVKIEFYNLSTEADPALKVRITYQTDQIAEFTFNQQTAGDGWADFGIYTFDGVKGEGVEVTRTSGNTRINQVRFTETTEEQNIKNEPVQNAPEDSSEQQAPPVENMPDTNEDGIIITTDDSAYQKNEDWVQSGLTGYGDVLSYYTTVIGAASTFKSPIQAGNAMVEFYNMGGNSAPGATIIVTYDADKTFERSIDQNKEDTGWINLGVFNFTGAEGEGVQLVKSEAGGYTRASAVRFTPTDAAVQPNEPEPEPTIPPEATVGDDDVNNIRMEGYTELSGEWIMSGLFGFRNSGTKYCGDVGGTAKWDPKIDTRNELTIYIYKVVNSNNDTNALYQVYHDGKVEDIRVDLTAGITGWYALGTFQFNGQGNEYVTLTKDNDTTDEAYIRADAVKFVAVSNDSDINNKYTQVIIVENDPPVYFVDVVFEDTKTHWAYDPIAIMANRGLVKGVDELHFNPDGNISRAEFTTLLTRIMELEEVPEKSFDDSEGWYMGYLTAAFKAGLFDGFPIENNKIYPDQPITREEMALMIANGGAARNKPTIPPATQKEISAFADGNAVSSWAQQACQYAVDNQIITGYEDNTFKPTNTATRAEATVMLKRFMELVLWAGPVDTSKQWTLTFADEFNGTELNMDVWESENKENLWSAIKSSRYPENVEVKDGYMYLMTKKNNPDKSNEWSSAYVWTKSFEQMYGYFEARYKYNDASGVNNAFWLMTNGKTNGMNPGEHEIDINEGHYPNKSSHNLHYYDKQKQGRTDKGYKVESTENYARDFHIFACEWTPEEIIYYVDGKEVHRENIQNTSVEDTASVVRFSTAVADFAGMITDELDGKAMIVDYVRVYQTDYSK